MKYSQFFIVFCLILLQACQSQNSKINGISFVASPSKINETHIAPLKKVSANFVALMPFAFVKDTASPKVIYNAKRQWFGETKEGLVQYATELKKSKIKVMVKPQIWVGRGQYTGFIKMNSEEDWKAFETSYGNYILHFAKTAETINADIFCIGTELEKFVKNRPEYWRNLILKIKKVYRGKLTYAANWDEFKRVQFWNELDFIGVDAYFPLTDKKSPTVQDFEAGWKPHKTEIKRIHQTYNKPVLFTEFGYRSIDFTGKEPWQSNRVEGSINLDAQKDGLQAIYNEFWKEDWFAGGFLWKWFHNHNEVGGTNNNRFTPQNKPAQELLKELYSK